MSSPSRGGESANLADILERVLDKGIVIAGDIQVNLLDIELLTIKLRLVIASVDKAKEMGIDWWEHDPTLSSGGHAAEENRRLRERIAELERGQETSGELPERHESHELPERHERHGRSRRDEWPERDDRTGPGEPPHRGERPARGSRRRERPDRWRGEGEGDRAR